MDPSLLLVAPPELRRYLDGSAVGEPVDGDEAKWEARAAAALAQAQDYLAGRLGYPPAPAGAPALLVARYSYPTSQRWHYDTDRASESPPSDAYYVQLDGGPPVVAAGAVGYAVEGLRLYAAEVAHGRLPVWRGWRGAHHEITIEGTTYGGEVEDLDPPEQTYDLNDVPGLKDLAAVPPRVAPSLAGFICEGAKLILERSRTDTAGSEVEVSAVGSESVYSRTPTAALLGELYEQLVPATFRRYAA